ncbi:MAG: carbohydrate kinase family protein [Prosthecobacter sp.]|uniref:carbohydrate kinase family protein n=1 Tax=Prosthecobacter sp. TaxID=1965333 RepID=UPI0039033E5A
MSKPRILSCGEVLWDLFPDGARFGGAPANFACHAAILGGEVSMLSAVGNDARGDEAIAILKGFGMDTSLVQRNADAPTGSVGVSVDAAGKPSFEIHAGSAWDRLEWTTELEIRIAETDAIYFGTLGQRGEVSCATIRRALSVAKARGILRVLDVNLRLPFYDAVLIRESIALASVLKLSDDELPEVAAAYGIAMTVKQEDTLQTLREQNGHDCVVMTRGADGALLVSALGAIDQPGIPTTVVDTVGAGDSFTAAFVLGLLRGDAHQDILRKACETASAVCAQSGAVPTLIKAEPSFSIS